MRLNSDCVRDLLLTVEEVVDFDNYLEYKKDNHSFHRLLTYSHNELIYHIRQCKLADLIIGTSYYDGGDFVIIQDLSPKGHEFLENIRSDNIWNNTKAIAGEVGSYSLNLLTTIAAAVLTQMINKQLGIS